MSVERARVIKGAGAGAGAGAGERARTEIGLGRRMPAAMVDAHGEAERILAAARGEAERLVREAAAAAAAVAESAAREAREAELARVTAEVLVARGSEERRAEQQLDRTIELAVLLAERLVGEAIAVEPARVQALAAGALRETRGARQLRIEACAEDLPALAQLVSELGEGVAKLEASPELARGSLVVHTDVGRIDARLAPQLGRLAEALREALRSAR